LRVSRGPAAMSPALAPASRRSPCLHKTDAPDQVNTLGVVRDAARALAIEVEPVRLNFVDEVESACDRAVQASADGLVDLHAPTFFGPEINSGITTIAFTKASRLCREASAAPGLRPRTG
jgi:hypothetical protein